MKVLLDRKFEYILEELEDVRDHIVFEPTEDVRMICGDHKFVNEYYTLPHLQTIQLASSGYNMLDLDYLRKHKITLLNSRGIYSIPIAEYVVSYILAIYKKHRMFDISQAKHEWNPDRSLKSIEGSTALLLGTGAIPQEVVKRLKGFDVTFIGLNSDGRMIEGFDQCDALPNFEKYLSSVDFVICALPENKATVKLLNKTHFLKMKPESVFINVGRGSLIDYDDVCQSIGHLKGFVIDVFEVEPMPSDHPLWDCPNVYITGHASAGSQNNNRRTTQLFANNIKRIISGEVPDNRVDLRKG
ncbi:hypothetical protein AOC36_00990 [Erysipelothrix larvae]|uniref:D-isomer specific 2-hydroxyacid dehydrogenase NAD-binding domain-containing protein n=1 Tax=Erysipelothrix larvae TaxID=1514105 RepID=A0A0X8GY89_9FIRM|nr:NAD(P)-dependent oxidoreductase [Erysipelothrix larvae]AMC92618.1 hypothetical protein AOC36_00990 [Erysipelothrix larvae]